jgi:WD40 repeat protein
MSDAFISYSRKNIAFARLLMEAFEKNKIQAWIDWQDIPPSADWLAEVYEAIEQSDAFIFIISENSVISEICSLEIKHAVENNKRLIPIVVNEVEPAQVPAPLADLQWIFFTEKDLFGEALEDLIVALQIDQDWVKAHTRLQNRALEWNRKGCPRSALIRGQNLIRAEDWFSQASGKDPAPSVLQSDFIFVSRNEANRRQRISSIAIAAGIIVAVGLGIWAWIQRAEAVQTTKARSTAEHLAIEEADTRATAQVEAVLEEQAKATAQAVLEDEIRTVSSRFLAARANALTNQEGWSQENLDLSLLLSLEALRLEDSLETRSALLSSLTAHPYLDRILFRETGIRIHNILFDPQENLIAVNYYDQELLIFDLERGNLIQKVVLPQAIANVSHPVIKNAAQDGIQYSADGSLMLTYAHQEKTWLLWDAETYTPIGDPFTENINTDRILNISPSFNLLAILEGDSIKIWERESGKLVQTIPEPLSGLIDLPLFSYDDQFLIVPTGENTLEIYDLASAEVSLTYEPGGKFGELKQYEINPQGTVLGLVGSDLIVVYDIKTETELLVYETEKDTGYWIFFDPSGQAFLAYTQYVFNEEKEAYDQENHYLVMIGEDQVLISRFESLSRWLYPTISHMNAATNPFYSIDSESFRIASHRSNQGNVELLLFDPLTITPILESITFNWEMEKSLPYVKVAFHPTDENLLAVGQCSADPPGSDCDLIIWDLVDNHPNALQSLEVDHPIQALSFHPQGELLAVANGDGELRIWNWTQGEMVFERNDPDLGADLIDFSANGQYLAAASSTRDDTILVLDPETGTELTKIKSELGKVSAIAFHPQNSWLAAAYGERVVLWDIEDGSRLAEFTHDGSVEIFDLLAFHPDGSQLVTGGEGGFARWDLETGELLSLPSDEDASSGQVQYLAYDPSGYWLVSCVGNRFRLHDPVTGKFVGELTPSSLEGNDHAYQFQRLALPEYNSTGSRFAAYARGNELLFWQLDLASWRAAACQIANRNLTPAEWMNYLGEKPYQETCPEYP